MVTAHAGGAAGTQLTGGEMPVVVDDRVEEVGPPGVFRVPHGPFIKEDILVGPREIPAILHVDNKEPMPGFPSCDGLQLGHHLHGELLQVLKCCGIPGDSGKMGGRAPQCCGRGERRVPVGLCAHAPPSPPEATITRHMGSGQPCTSHIDLTHS